MTTIALALKIQRCTACLACRVPRAISPLLIEPGTDFWVVDAPGFNLPPTVHDDYLEFHWLSKINDCWGADLMVTPGWHSDYQNANGSQAFRLGIARGGRVHLVERFEDCRRCRVLGAAECQCGAGGRDYLDAECGHAL